MEIIRPENEYWIQDKLDTQMMDYVWSQIKLARVEVKNKLEGHVSSSLGLPDLENKFSPYLLDLAKNLQYMYHPGFQVRDLWVNFNKKHDFNPLHHHFGALSFVLWMKIPYDRGEEAKTTQAKGLSNPHLNGAFRFIYSSVLGRITQYDYRLDPTWEGTLVMFPATLLHEVYPFYTSDLDRISISGNIY
tara:strand:- start:183 stop:749 length:567 start_codon:yes stop_codon:yes gene_type:complete